jgi:anti-sigma regulatory factor (Ser/Thr protein kinase)
VTSAPVPGEAAERFTLEIPGDPAYVATARLFAWTLARHFGVSEELLEDLKLAVSEACVRALTTAADRPVAMAAERTAGRLAFQVSQGATPGGGDPEMATPTPEEMAAGLSMELITALFEDAEVTQGHGGPAVHFSVPAA